MNFSAPFIRRPIGTTLMAIGLFLAGALAYTLLPVASLPSIDFPTIRIIASRPGADPAIMAATVAAPLERRLGEIAGVTEITSVSSLGSSVITVQFDLNRDIDKAARDVQAAINAAMTDLPSDLPTVPTFRKSNPAAAPVLILALTSSSLNSTALYDVADSVIAQRLSQSEGVAEVTVSGADQPAIRIRVNPIAITSMGISMEDVRTAIANANVLGPVGAFSGTYQAESIIYNGQISKAEDYKNIVVKTNDGSIVRLSAIASVEQSVRNIRSGAWFNRQPAVLLIVTKQPDANVIDTVDRIKAMLPDIKRYVPADVDVSILTDRTTTIRASVLDMQYTLAGTVVLVMFVVFAFLRRTTPTIAAGVTVPLSLAGTCAGMWIAGFTIDNLSLMALAVSVGFIVDDAIVVIENVFRNLDKGMRPLRATMEGARQIGFTVIAISVSLIAAFIPLLFMGGIVGRLFREFSVTLAIAIAVSTVLSLSVTPMICAHFVRETTSHDATRFDRLVESVLSRMIRFYEWSLRFFLHFRGVTLVIFLLTVVLTVQLFIRAPKGYFPQDDTGLLFGSTQASTDISYQALVDLQRRAVDIILEDPAVESVGSAAGASGFGSANQGRLFVALKPLDERGGLSAVQVIARLRGKLAAISGLSTYLFPVQDLRAGGRQTRSQYQFTLWGPDVDDLQTWVPRVVERMRRIPGLVDVNTDREQGGLQANLVVDRLTAARLGVKMQDIDNALNNAFSQRQISTIYTQRNQYRVILEIDPQFQRDPQDLDRVYVAAGEGVVVPLSAVARFEKSLAPLVVNHQGQFPSVTISYNLTPGGSLDQATRDIQNAVGELHLPDTIRAEPAGAARDFAQNAGAQPILIIAALLTVYIVLGILYESLAHPLTIISTLPSAGLGALLALQLFNTEVSIIALIGIILLIGIVKKNGIMLVDFALEGERKRGLSPEQAILEACRERFRPILMTTLAALLGAVPLILAVGPGSELRRPLGITIIGGLLVSQVLTLYTTPVIYLLLDKLHHMLGGGLRRTGTETRPAPAADPA